MSHVTIFGDGVWQEVMKLNEDQERVCRISTLSFRKTHKKNRVKNLGLQENSCFFIKYFWMREH